jgi:hypothetical protein
MLQEDSRCLIWVGMAAMLGSAAPTAHAEKKATGKPIALYPCSKSGGL